MPPGVNPALKNAAAVMITADLPAFAKPGQRLDITVSALGKASSLRGGTLIMTPLRGADNQIYAMAQGNLAVGGLGVSAQDGSQVSVNVPSSGRIPGGATVERAVETGFATAPGLIFNLSESDFTTAQRVADAINRELGQPVARAQDGVSIAIQAPQGAEVRTTLMSRVENIVVEPADAPARVIVNARTGTVVINGAVRISPAAVSHGRLTVAVQEDPHTSQPAPLSRGETVVEQHSNITVTEHRSPMFELGARRLARRHRPRGERDRGGAVRSGRDPRSAQAGRRVARRSGDPVIAPLRPPQAALPLVPQGPRPRSRRNRPTRRRSGARCVPPRSSSRRCSCAR